MTKRRPKSPLVRPIDLFAVLREFNPWWDRKSLPDLPTWRRAAFPSLISWLADPPARRAVLLSGARQVGKTTLLLQAATELLKRGTPAPQILYATFDHPLLKLVGLEGVVRAWRELQPASTGPEFLLLDEIQSTSDWETWIKHQTDFQANRRIAVTGSALPLAEQRRESGVGRWHTIKLPTLSFFEYLQIRGTELPPLPKVGSLARLFEWTESQFARAALAARPLVGDFHEYLLRGGFPQTARVEHIHTAQRLLREDIVDKVLKRDMTALFGVRRILELEKVFVYLSLHDGGILDIAALCSALELNKKTVGGFVDLLEASNLVYRLSPFGYGKEVLRGKHKVYLADAAIAGSVLLRGRGLLEDNERLSAAVETALFKHVFTNYYLTGATFSYWRGSRDREVDIVTEVGDQLIPLEVKYKHAEVRSDMLPGLREFCAKPRVRRAYVVTRNLNDFGPIDLGLAPDSAAQVMRIPAPLACLWLSRLELDRSDASL
ncbi:MAG TPA: ATP-binding protein [Phycisphaerales bacterium]|nr:ATP-binding protein [Phycisphaerales bacterium]